MAEGSEVVDRRVWRCVLPFPHLILIFGSYRGLDTQVGSRVVGLAHGVLGSSIDSTSVTHRILRSTYQVKANFYFLLDRKHSTNNFIMRASSNLDFLQAISGRTDTRLGYTTTVKEQVDDIEVTMDHFKKSLEGQRKSQSEIQLQLKKLEEQTKTHFGQIAKEISERVNYLTQSFRADLANQNKEFEYLELQNRTLHDEHDRLHELGSTVMSQTDQIENSVGV